MITATGAARAKSKATVSTNDTNISHNKYGFVAGVRKERVFVVYSLPRVVLSYSQSPCCIDALIKHCLNSRIGRSDVSFTGQST